MKWRLPGPQLPAQAVRRPVSSASAEAAKAPASSCRMWTQSISLRSMAWAIRFKRVADDPVARPDAGSLQRFDQQIGHSFTHDWTS